MKTWEWLIVGFLLLKFLKPSAAVGTGSSSLNVPFSAPLLPGAAFNLTPAQIAALNAGSDVGQVTGLTTDSSGDLIVNLDPNAGVLTSINQAQNSAEQNFGTDLLTGGATDPSAPIGVVPGLTGTPLPQSLFS